MTAPRGATAASFLKRAAIVTVAPAIRIRGARQHNLKGFDLDIPRRAITVITGPSGSGKSSLAFDTIYAEGQRRYVESLSAYARQFLERMHKPAVDFVDGLSPAIAIEQKNPTRTSRSTVGTATEIYDYLRLLWARVGRTTCPQCGRELRPDSPESAATAILGLDSGARIHVTFPLRRSAKFTHSEIVENLRAQGFIRVVADGEGLHLDELPPAANLANARELLVVTDRLAVAPDIRARLTDALETAFREGDGDAIVIAGDSRHAFTQHFRCPNDGHVAPAPTPQLFSFNNPRGACPTCNGFGATLEYDEALIVRYPERTLKDGALDPWTMPRYDNKRRALAEFCRREKIPTDRPWRNLTAAQREVLLRGKAKGFMGVIRHLESLEPKKYKQYIRVFLRRYQSAVTCPSCHGAKLQPDALNVKVGGRSIAEVSAMPIASLRAWADSLFLAGSEQEIAAHVLREARSRIRFLCDVGLTYLTLGRAARTLSGGEAQRITLANSLGSRLVDTTYVLDEPSIGLHPRDLGRLLAILARLRDGGNTVVVVEHDLDAIRAADWMVELGPGSGDNGGTVVFNGPVADAPARSPLTGKYLSGELTLRPGSRPRELRRWLALRGARQHNLRGVDVRFPLSALTCVTGVSGSGKSTLVHDVLFRALERTLTGEHSAKLHLGEALGAYDSLDGCEGLDEAVMVDQEPIGRTPRSNPVTYVKAFDEIRRIFAATPLARERKYTASTFSFNVAGGRCERCQGAGYQEVEMLFMADLFLPCEECDGRRFKAEVLDVKVNGRSIVDALDLTVDQAIRAFPREDKLGQALWQVQQVGLGYLRLGQAATTLSGGEAQRLKIARQLIASGKSRGRKLFVMDEPTTGLHLDDIGKLMDVLGRLVDAGHTVVLIEHNLDVIATADWVIDLGPEGGDAGGRVIATGRPADIARNADSHTGQWLQRHFAGNPLPIARRSGSFK
ncbi:MAG: excinuclease ABC subunit UvrA [Gemmatimonadaceae bacterium]|nr:excinuclease ABC subunit UvrA [Gemmatimonadaceae bacterium]